MIKKIKSFLVRLFDFSEPPDEMEEVWKANLKPGIIAELGREPNLFDLILWFGGENLLFLADHVKEVGEILGKKTTFGEMSSEVDQSLRRPHEHPRP